MTTYSQHLSGWLDYELDTPIGLYRRPLRALAQRVAATAILGRDVERYGADLASLTKPPRDLADWGDLTAARLLIENVVDEAAARCVALYLSDPDADLYDSERASKDELALGLSLLVGDAAAARIARARRLSRNVTRSTAISAQLMFLANQVQCDPTGEPAVFSFVRSIYSVILMTHWDSVAPYVCAFGAAARSGIRVRVNGALLRLDDLSFAEEHKPYRLIAERVEIPSGALRMRMVVRAPADGLRLDAMDADPLTDDLPNTLRDLRRALDPAGKRRFDRLRKKPGTVLEIAIVGADGLRGGDVLARRVEAALALMEPNGYAIGRVEVLSRRDGS